MIQRAATTMMMSTNSSGQTFGKRLHRLKAHASMPAGVVVVVSVTRLTQKRFANLSPQKRRPFWGLFLGVAFGFGGCFIAWLLLMKPRVPTEKLRAICTILLLKARDSLLANYTTYFRQTKEAR